MKSNPYVYPSRSYKNLQRKVLADRFEKPRVVDVTYLHRLLRCVPTVRWTSKGKTVEEKIFQLFLSKDVLFGPAAFLTDCTSMWLEKFSVFTRQKQPLLFTILGFPFKMPVSLKTRRRLPDMGEMLILHRLAGLARAIKKVYRPGARITIFTEGGFGAPVGVPESDWQVYHTALEKWVSVLGFADVLEVRRLSDMEQMKGFSEAFARRRKENASKLKKKDASFLQKVEGAYMPMFRLVNSEAYPLELLMDVYNDALSEEELSSSARRVRLALQRQTMKTLVYYFSYLQARDDVRFLETAVPGFLALSVSPKPERLGVIPVSREVSVLPYHGVPVYDTKKKRWSIEYLIDIRRDRTAVYTPIHVKGDKDKEPFFYEKG